MIIRYPDLSFGGLTKRTETDMIVLHHTGGNDIDASAEQIHQWHINQEGWAGIGYHFVIRKSGVVEIGRPEWAVGSHAYGENYHTLGIHLSGDFETAEPTAEQILACADLVKDLCRDYHIPLDREHIVGHRDLMPTDCPGKNLYCRIEDIINLNSAAESKPVPVTNVFELAQRYESNGNPAAIGYGYGLYQFTRQTVKDFIEWLKKYPDDKLANYGRHLDAAKNFDGEWQMLATVDPINFSQLQNEFALETYLGGAQLLFEKENYHIDKHSIVMKAVVFARAVQHGIYGCLELFRRACRYPNLSYVDDVSFDRELIADVYDYLIANPAYGLAVDKLNDALRDRFRREKEDALA